MRRRLGAGAGCGGAWASPRNSKVTLPGGEVLNLTDFKVIDEDAFNKLPDEAFLDLRKSGALALIYCHLASSNSWTSLIHQAATRKTAKAGR